MLDEHTEYKGTNKHRESNKHEKKKKRSGCNTDLQNENGYPIN